MLHAVQRSHFTGYAANLHESMSYFIWRLICRSLPKGQTASQPLRLAREGMTMRGYSSMTSASARPPKQKPCNSSMVTSCLAFSTTRRQHSLPLDCNGREVSMISTNAFTKMKILSIVRYGTSLQGFGTSYRHQMSLKYLSVAKGSLADVNCCWIIEYYVAQVSALKWGSRQEFKVVPRPVLMAEGHQAFHSLCRQPPLQASLVGLSRLRKPTFLPLAQEEGPQPGLILGLDAEFVAFSPAIKALRG